MEWANGMTSDQITQSKAPIDCTCDKNVLQQLSDIEVLDFICGNVDRHMGNLIFTVENNRIVSVKGVDKLKAQIRKSIDERSEGNRLRLGFTRILNDNDKMWDEVDIPKLASVCTERSNKSIYKRMADEFRPQKTVNGIESLADIDEYRSTKLDYVRDPFLNIDIPKNGQFTTRQLGTGGGYKPEAVTTGARFGSELYKRMGITDITDCIYVGSEKLLSKSRQTRKERHTSLKKALLAKMKYKK